VFSVSLWFKNGGTQTGKFPKRPPGNKLFEVFEVFAVLFSVGRFSSDILLDNWLNSYKN
jgi:hypothetical protein